MKQDGCLVSYVRSMLVFTSFSGYIQCSDQGGRNKKHHFPEVLFPSFCARIFFCGAHAHTNQFLSLSYGLQGRAILACMQSNILPLLGRQVSHPSRTKLALPSYTKKRHDSLLAELHCISGSVQPALSRSLFLKQGPFLPLARPL